MEEKIYCSHCGDVIEGDDYDTIYGEPICQNCVDDYTVVCDRCDSIVCNCDSHSDDDICLCGHCYENYYTRCEECNSIVHNDDAYEYDDYAEEILDIANEEDDHIYIKTYGSLDDGMELVSYPMTLDYHKDFCCEDVMNYAVRLGYRSHQTNTCGLHIYVNRNSFGDERDEQDEVISRILYFVEHHWNEMLKFSRRSEYTINRWAARYGYENSPKAIMDKAKKNYGRYVAVNLCNYATIEFRLFRGTFKYNTFIATIELVVKICDTACIMTDDEIAKLSWSEFVAGITEPELIQYLKEHCLYINEKITSEEEM